MKKILLLSLVVILSACSKNPSSDQPTLLREDKLVSVILSSGSGDMGEVTSSKAITLITQNMGNEPTPEPAMLSLSGTHSSSFLIYYTLGCNQVIDKTKKCTIKLSFSPIGKEPGTYEAMLNVGSFLSIPLKAVIPAPEGSGSGGSGGGSGGTGGGASSLIALVNSIDSSSGVSFGSFTGTQSVVKTIVLKNMGTVDTQPLTASLSSSDFYMAYNQCSNIVLKPTKQCQVKVSFSASGKTGQDYLSNLNFGDLAVPLSATVVSTGGSSGGGSGGSGGGGSGYSLSLLESATEVSDPLDFGTFSGSQSLTKVLYVKNTGTATVKLTAEMDSPNFSIIFTQCTNRNLAVNATCQLRLQFSASGKSAQVYSGNINFADQEISFPVQATVGGVSCLPSQHIEGSLCVDNIVSCPIDNGTGQKIWAGSAYGACSVVDCNNGFESVSNQCLAECLVSEHREGLVCATNIRSCPITNGIGQQTWNGTQYGACVASSCVEPFELYQNQCYSQMIVSPSSSSATSGAIVNLSVSGGVPPYSYQIDPATSIGSVIEPFSGDNSMGIFTAGLNSGSTAVNESVKITDQRGVFVTSVINVSPNTTTNDLELAGDNSNLQYGNNYSFTATGGTPPYSYSVISAIGSVVDSNTGAFTPGDNQQIDTAIDMLKVTDNSGAFVEIRLNVESNIQSIYPVLYNSRTGQYVSYYSDNDSMIGITIKNTPVDKYLRVYDDSTCSGNQIYESYSYGGDNYVNDNIWDSYDVSRTYSVSVEDVDPETQQPLYSNVECSSYTVTYYYDITPPEIYSISATGDGSNSIQLSVGTGDSNSQVTYYKDLNCTDSIGGNLSSGNFSYDIGSNPGVFFFTAKIEDEAGNASECSNGGNSSWGTMNYYASYEHLLGDAGLYPIVVGNSVDNNVAYYNQLNIPVYVYGNSIEYEYADLFLNNTCSGTPAAIANGTSVSPYSTYIPGQFVSGSIYNDENQNPLVDGTYQVYARRGNEQTSYSCSVSSMPFVIDTQAPIAPSISLVQGTYNSVGNINFTIDGMEPNVVFSLGRSCQNSPYGVIPYADTIDELNNFSASSYNYNLGNNGGIYRFGVSIKDRAGNYSQCSNLITYEYDNGKPYITQISSSNADAVYGLGQNINVRLTFNKPIQKLNDSGSITLKISNSISRNVPLSSAVVSGNNLDFTYTVQANDNTGTGKISVQNFSNSGGIVDASNTLLVANTKVPDSGILKRLEEGHSLKADGVGPTTGTLAFAISGGGNNYSNSPSSSAPVNILTTGADQGGGVIAGYEVAIGTSTSNRTNVLDWTPVGNGLSNLAATGLNLSQTTYYLSFRSYDNFGNRSGFFRFSGQTYGIFVVDSLPTSGKISFVDDREFGTSDVQTMSINFGAAITATGEASDVAKYFVAIGTEPGGTSILNWSDINNHNIGIVNNNSISKRYKVQVTALNLDENTTYYASIKYCDLASNCKEAYGNGFTLKNSDIFDQKNYMKSSNKIANGKFGSAVAIEGNYMVVGAPGEGTGGKVYVYKRVPGTNQLVEEVVLSGSNTESGDEFGASVAISGNRIIVGAPAEDGATNSISNSGAAYIFKKSTSWLEESILRAHNAGVDDRYGDRVKISQLNAAVAALYEDSDHTGVTWTAFLPTLVDNNNVSNSGAVYTYTVDPVSQLWTHDGYIKKTNSGTCGSGSGQCAESANDNFGFSMDLKGPVLVIGTPFHDLAHIGFQNNYIQTGTSASGSSNAAHRSGYPNSGGVYVFHKQTYIWQGAYALRSPNIDPGDEFGYSVSINELDSVSYDYGSSLPINIPHHTIAIGAPGEDHGNFISSVHTDVYQRGGTVDNLTQGRFFTGTSSLPIFGASGSTGTFLNNNVTDSGAVYVFAFEPLWYGQSFSMQVGGGSQSISMHLHSFVKAPNLGAGDRFGSSVALVGNTTYGWDRIINSSVPASVQRAIGYLVVGAPKEDNSETGVQLWATSANIWNGTSIISDNNLSSDSGAVYVFKSGYENTVNSPSQQRTDFVLQQYIKAPVAKSGDEFGSQVAASVNSWIIGVPLDDANATSSESTSGSSDSSLSNSGAAYIINNID